MAFNLFPPTKYSPRRLKVKLEPTVTREEKIELKAQERSLSWSLVLSVVAIALILAGGILYLTNKNGDKKLDSTEKSQIPDLKLSL